MLRPISSSPSKGRWKCWPSLSSRNNRRRLNFIEGISDLFRFSLPRPLGTLTERLMRLWFRVQERLHHFLKLRVFRRIGFCHDQPPQTFKDARSKPNGPRATSTTLSTSTEPFWILTSHD